MHRSRILAASGLILLVTGCSMQLIAPEYTTATLMPETSACVERLAGRSEAISPGLDSDDFSIVNWNIQKGKDADWVADLQALNGGPDLLILQEALLQTDEWESLVPGYFRSFAEGFGRDSSPSGVMTVSAARPLTECALVVHEPWIGTRKATLVTEYALTNTDKTLLVVNIHGINFTFGVRKLKNQLQQAQAIIAGHDGPVLFSGDFNTWRGGRARVLEEIVGDLDLVPLEYDVDHRKRIFGRALDHIYLRGLSIVHATTTVANSSDHNPMSVRLRLSKQPVRVGAAR